MTSTEVSLDAPVERQDRGASTFGERVAGTGGGDIEEMTDVRLQREFIDRIFERYLTPRERKILSLYYGLEEGSEALTLEKIGALLGRDPGTDPADSGAGVREAARIARRAGAQGILGGSMRR